MNQAKGRPICGRIGCTSPVTEWGHWCCECHQEVHDRPPKGGHQPVQKPPAGTPSPPVDPSGSPQDPSNYSPKIGEACLYKERGGVNWCACHIICEYDGLIWIHNFYTGAHPVKRRNQILFKPMPRGLLGVVE